VRILSLHLEDFMGFPEVDIDLRGASPIVAVQARYAGMPRRSNRAGKSALFFDAPMFALDGWTRTGNARDVVRRGASRAVVVLEMELPGRILRVRREARLVDGGTRAATSVDIDGAEGLSVKDADAAIQEALGIPPADLRSITLFEQFDVLGFLGGDQREQLSRWLDQSRWEGAERIAKDRHRAAEREAGTAEDVARQARETEEDLPRLREEAENASEAAAAAQAELKAAEDEVSYEAEKAAVKDAWAVVERHQAALDSARAAFKAAESASKRERDALVQAADADLRAATLEARNRNVQRTASIKAELEGFKVSCQRADRALSEARSAETAAKDAVKRAMRDQDMYNKYANRCLDDLEAARSDDVDSPCHVVSTAPCSALSEQRSATRAAAVARAEAAYEEAGQKLEGYMEAVRAAREALTWAETATRSRLKAAETAMERFRAAQKRLDEAESTSNVQEEQDVTDAEMAYEKRVQYVEEHVRGNVRAQGHVVEQTELALLDVLGKHRAAEEALEAARARGRRVDLRRLRERAGVAVERSVTARTRLREAEALASRVDELDREAARLTRRARALRILRQAFGRDGIPAVAVEAHLGQLSRDANDFLERLGAEPRVKWRTYKELTTWRKSCFACDSGTMQGRGDKRRCGECGAPWRRERKRDLSCVLTIGGREVPLASDSGGGRTLVALAVRFAAARLVASARGVSADMLILDEPFAALDGAALEDALRLVTGVLGAYGVRQAFLISHLPGVQDVAGDLVTVVRDGSTSSVEVTWR
jgi:hypothetical protein